VQRIEGFLLTESRYSEIAKQKFSRNEKATTTKLGSVPEIIERNRNSSLELFQVKILGLLVELELSVWKP